MKAFACGDVVPGCDARWVTATEDELLRELAEHAAAEHGLDEVSDELLVAVKAAIVEVD